MGRDRQTRTDHLGAPERTPIIPPAYWNEPTPALPLDPENDPLGLAFRHPPSFPCPREQLPTGRPLVTVVEGSSNVLGASYVAGRIGTLEQLVNPIHYQLASGSTIGGLAAAAGIPNIWRRIMNAGAPSRELLGRVTKADGTDMDWIERHNFDLAGIFEVKNEPWLGEWLRWGGVHTWNDLRYQPGELNDLGYGARRSEIDLRKLGAPEALINRAALKPETLNAKELHALGLEGANRTVDFKANISVVVWKTKRGADRLYDQATLDNPEFVHKVFQQYFFNVQEFPFKKFKEYFLPQDIGIVAPWLAEDFGERPPEETANWSMRQWPAVVPKLLQDPVTRQFLFIADGGHIHNQPNRFNDGTAPAWPMINARTKLDRKHPEAQRRADQRGMPFALVTRDERVGKGGGSGLGEANNLIVVKRDGLFVAGGEDGRDELAETIEDYMANFALQGDRVGNQRLPVAETWMHGFRIVAAAEHDHQRSATLQL